jgi:hypothetical protein
MAPLGPTGQAACWGPLPSDAEEVSCEQARIGAASGFIAVTAPMWVATVWLSDLASTCFENSVIVCRCFGAKDATQGPFRIL